MCATYSQGRVKFPTGGMFLDVERARERLPAGRVSRSGVRPEPTVRVRMGEDKAVASSVSDLALGILLTAIFDCGYFHMRPDSSRSSWSEP